MLVNVVHPQKIAWSLLLPWGQVENQSPIVFISADSAYMLFVEDEAVFVDVRDTADYQLDHIPGAVSLTLMQYYHQPDRIARWERELPYVFYCFEAGCPEAEQLAEEFARSGFSRLMILYEGYAEWLARQYPVEKGEE